MAENKTTLTDKSVVKFLNKIKDRKERQDCLKVVALMKEATKAPPRMWGSSIVGFGDYHYKGKSGREGDWFLTGFSPRKRSLTLYIMGGFAHYEGLRKKLGKNRGGKSSCLYINDLEEIHIPTLKKLVRESVAHLRQYQKSKGL